MSMTKIHFIFKILCVIALISVIIFTYSTIVNPWYSKWGAMENEQKMPFPGDDIVTTPNYRYTQAITIHTSKAAVWQWLVQIGQARGGFYSFELLENMIGCDIQNADRIMPQFQNLAVGDSIKLHPEAPGILVVVVDSAKAIVSGGRNENHIDASSWSFLLKELDINKTRLIARFRSSYSPTIESVLLQRLFVEPTSLFMQKKMLIGLKQRAEGTFHSSVPDHIQVILWMVLFAIFVIASISIFLKFHWMRLYIVGFASAFALMMLVSWQPSVLIGIPLTIFIIVAFVWAFKKPVRN